MFYVGTALCILGGLLIVAGMPLIALVWLLAGFGLQVIALFTSRPV